MKGTEGDKLLCAATHTVMFSTVREDHKIDNKTSSYGVANSRMRTREVDTLEYS